MIFIYNREKWLYYSIQYHKISLCSHRYIHAKEMMYLGNIVRSIQIRGAVIV